MTSPSPEVIYLAQLLDQPASETRRTTVPTEAFAEGPLRHVYRAILAAAHDHPVVSVEAVVAELVESGRLAAVGGRDAVEAIGDHMGAQPIDGARVELVAHATQRLLISVSHDVSAAARGGRARDAMESMQATQRLVMTLQGGSEAVALKSMQQHLAEYVKRAAEGERQAPAAKVPLIGRAFGEPMPGVMALIYGFSQSGKSYLMQYLEALYSEAGFPTLRISCEDADAVNAGRLMSEACDMDASHPNDLRKEDWARILSRTRTPSESWGMRYVNEHTPSAEAIAQTIRMASAQAGVKVAFVDYAQMLRTANGQAETQEARLAEATELLKATAKESGVYLFIGSQVTVRDPKPGKIYVPSPYDLKGGRVLYEKADQAIALWVGSEGRRFAEVQKDKLRGMMGTRVGVNVGKAGVITGLYPLEAETTQSGGYGGQYGKGSRRDFQDGDDR